MHISSAIFDCSAPDLESCPDESLPEFAFIGRSNVGKSSLLNMLAGNRDLARVSNTPGHTRLINIFTINKNWRLVDLPGYGFAKGSRKDRSKFNQAVASYLAHRENLNCVFALIDSGLPPQKIDLEFVEWLVRNSVPFVLVFTKFDRVKALKARTNMEAVTNRISKWFIKPPEIFTCSATTGQGRDELLGVIEEAIDGVVADHSDTGSPPDEDESGMPFDSLPASGGKASARPPPRKRPNPARPW